MSKKILFGGVLGMLLYGSLWLLYTSILLPIAQYKEAYQYNDAGEIAYDTKVADWVFVPMTLTGHIVPALSHFIIPHGFLCEQHTPTCLTWNNEQQSIFDVPWTLETGEAGYCFGGVDYVVNERCAEKSERLVGYFLHDIMIYIYFLLGMLVTFLLPKMKKHKT